MAQTKFTSRSPPELKKIKGAMGANFAHFVPPQRR
jgi:hypothetical protein